MHEYIFQQVGLLCRVFSDLVTADTFRHLLDRLHQIYYVRCLLCKSELIQFGFQVSVGNADMLYFLREHYSRGLISVVKNGPNSMFEVTTLNRYAGPIFVFEYTA